MDFRSAGGSSPDGESAVACWTHRGPRGSPGSSAMEEPKRNQRWELREGGRTSQLFTAPPPPTGWHL